MMKMSEAIRLGSMLKPQAFGAYHDSEGTCALMAAYEAVNENPCEEGDDPFEGMPARVNRRCQCPACGRIEREDHHGFAVGYMIAHLNDDHRWTREAIADWVESVERQQEPREALQALSLVGVGIEP